MARRILLLITDLEIGGTPTVVRELANRLRQPEKVVVAVACLAKWGPVATQLRDAGVDVTAFGATSIAALPSAVMSLVRLVRQGGFDTVFSFLLHANATAAIASPFLPGVRIFFSIQTTQPNPAWHWHLHRLLSPIAEKIIVPASSVASAAQSRSGIAADQLVVIPNAVDVEAFDAIYASNIARPAQSPVRVGFLGRLDPIKQIPVLIQAIRKLPAARLDLFGEGAERRRIEADVARFGLQSRVTLHGAVDRPQQALAEMDVLVLPSAAEGFGLVLIEAMAAGVPVVANDAPGIRDVVRHGVNGLLYDGTPAGLATAIIRASQSEHRERMIPAARMDVESRFAWPAILDLYRRTLGIS